MISPSKPKAIVFAAPFEGRISYFLAGLSYFYELTVCYIPSSRFRYAWQTFYKRQYAKDAEFIKIFSAAEFLPVAAAGNFEAAFIQEEPLQHEYRRFESQKEVLFFLQKIKESVKKMYWLELGELSYYYFGRPEFWELVDGVVKGQVFKPQFNYLLKDPIKISNFQGKELAGITILSEENKNFNIEKYYNKIIPFPFTPSVTEAKSLDFSSTKKIYDIAANTRTGGNGKLRYSIIKLIEQNLSKKYSYSFDYDEQGIVRNLAEGQNSKDWYLFLGNVGKRLFKLKYGKYFYPGPAYIHNLSRSRCYLGLGWTFSSLRTADCWGAGVVLINFSFNKCDYGIPVEDGKTYISLGERDEMTGDNTVLKPGFEAKIMGKVEGILSDRQKQKEIINNQKQIYHEYFSSPEQFVKKIFMEKTRKL